MQLVEMDELACVLTKHNISFNEDKLNEIIDMLDLELIEDALEVTGNVNKDLKLELIEEQLVELEVI